MRRHDGAKRRAGVLTMWKDETPAMTLARGSAPEMETTDCVMDID